MKLFRCLSPEENAVLVALLQANPKTMHFVDLLEGLLVQEMNDGGMGSLLLIPSGLDDATRSFGRQLVSGQFDDSDGVLVSVAVNVDSHERLFELDIWKVNFAPLLRWPKPSAIRIDESSRESPNSGEKGSGENGCSGDGSGDTLLIS